MPDTLKADLLLKILILEGFVSVKNQTAFLFLLHLLGTHTTCKMNAIGTDTKLVTYLIMNTDLLPASE